MLAYLVAQRRREIGVRIAIGAARAAVVRMVLRQSLRYIVPGIVLGLIASLALPQGLRSQWHGVSAADPLTFVTLAALLGVVALAASWWPAHRASRVDPISALREE